MANQLRSECRIPSELPGVHIPEDLRRLTSHWVDNYHAEIYRFLARLSKDVSMAEDLTQETFVQAFRSCQRLRDPDSARAWLYRIAWNTYLSHRRSVRRHASDSANEAAEIHEVRDRRPDAENELLSLEVRRRMNGIVERLPLQQRGAFILRICHELSYADVARCLGCSPAAARSHFRHALQKLRKACRQEGLHL